MTTSRRADASQSGLIITRPSETVADALEARAVALVLLSGCPL
jgi:hypothetical protein